ncbi:MAG TPA: hypothetical protein VF254_06845 [Gammaproteobacteria bacterium]
MRRTDIALALGFVILVLGLVFLPDLISSWRAGEDRPMTTAEPVAPEPEAEAAIRREPLDPEEELERVTGMLMLHEACADRFEGFAERAEPVVASWRELNAATLDQPAAEPDFHIVFGEAEGLETETVQEAKAAERELCEGNLEAMRSEIESAPAQVD